MQFPLISIVTVVYNAIDTIENTVQSVLRQTYKNIEYIVVDGASSDGTFEVLERYVSKINLVSEQDEGIYDAMNKAHRLANGDWIYFLGADDIFEHDNVVSDVVTKFDNLNSVYYGSVKFTSSGRIYNKRHHARTLCYRNLPHQAIFYPKSIYKTRNYNQSYKIFADHIYNIELSGIGVKMDYMDIVVAKYSDRGRSSSSFDKHYYDNLASTVRKNLGLLYSFYVGFRLILFRLKRNIK